MALRTIPTQTALGAPLTITVVTREEISFENATCVINSVNDDGISITAEITFVNGDQRLLTLFEGAYYEPIANFLDAEINDRIIEILRG